MQQLKFVAIITGPDEYLKGGFKVEEFTINEDEVSEVIEDAGGDPDNPKLDEVIEAISYLKGDYADEWEQRWCRAILLTEDQFELLKKMENISS